MQVNIFLRQLKVRIDVRENWDFTEASKEFHLQNNF